MIVIKEMNFCSANDCNMHFVLAMLIQYFMFILVRQELNQTNNYALIAIGEQIYRQGIITADGQWRQACLQAAV